MIRTKKKTILNRKMMKPQFEFLLKNQKEINLKMQKKRQVKKQR